jgi:hypothetical protein
MLQGGPEERHGRRAEAMFRRRVEVDVRDFPHRASRCGEENNSTLSDFDVGPISMMALSFASETAEGRAPVCLGAESGIPYPTQGSEVQGAPSWLARQSLYLSRFARSSRYQHTRCWLARLSRQLRFHRHQEARGR